MAANPGKTSRSRNAVGAGRSPGSNLLIGNLVVRSCTGGQDDRCQLGKHCDGHCGDLRIDPAIIDQKGEVVGAVNVGIRDIDKVWRGTAQRAARRGCENTVS